jgi:hypothetical protein
MNKQRKLVADTDKQLYGDESDKLERLKPDSKSTNVIDAEDEPGQGEREEQPSPEVRGENKKLIDKEHSR